MQRREIAMAVTTGVAALGALFGPALIGAVPLNPFQVIACTATGMAIGWFIGLLLPATK